MFLQQTTLKLVTFLRRVLPLSCLLQQISCSNLGHVTHYLHQRVLCVYYVLAGECRKPFHSKDILFDMTFTVIYTASLNNFVLQSVEQRSPTPQHRVPRFPEPDGAPHSVSTLENVILAQLPNLTYVIT
jgi:hypothetical protein